MLVLIHISSWTLFPFDGLYCSVTDGHLPLCRGEIYPVETDERLCDILETGESLQLATAQYNV